MKNDVILRFLVSFVMAIVLMILNLNSFVYFFVHLLLLLVLFMATLNKKTSWFIFIFVMFIINSIYMLAFTNSVFVIFIYYIWNVFMLIYSYKYVFNLNNNSMNIQFKILKVPENKECLVVRHLGGLVDKININGFVTKIDSGFEVSLEDNDGKIYKNLIKFDDINEVKVSVKPYFKSYDSVDSYNVDFMKSYSIGKIAGEFDIHKAKKIIKSYEIIISTNTSKIKLLSFDDPKFMFS